MRLLVTKCGKLKEQSLRGENATRWQLRITVLMRRGHWLMFWTSKIYLASLVACLPTQQHEASHWALAFSLGTGDQSLFWQQTGSQTEMKLKAFSYFPPKRRQTLLHRPQTQTQIRQGRKLYMTIGPRDNASKEATNHSLHTTVSISTAQVQRTSSCGFTRGASLRPRNIANERKWKITIIHPKWTSCQHHKSTLQACEISMER